MQSETDAELLRTYAANGSETAFGELVRRHADLVYSAAFRQVGDPETARDVTQSVFTDLARKARSLRPEVLLAGWLYRGTRYAALNELRSERRRQQRERLAMALLEPAHESALEWDVIRPVIDEAMASLNDLDRDAVLLRFFKNQDLAMVGAAFGISEDAAQKRVTRALDKLRAFLARRGVKSATVALASVLSANAVQSAPTGLAAGIATGAFAAGKMAASGLGLAQWIPSFKTAAVIGMIAAVAGLTGVHFKLRDELRDARTTTEQLTSQLEQLRAENQRLAARQIDPAELERLRKEAEDVHRLRAEAGRLRRELAQAPTKAPPISQPTTTNGVPVAVPEIQTQVVLESKFVEVPDSVLKKVGAGWLASGTASVNGVLTPHQSRQLLDMLEKCDGVDFFGAPRVVTLSGREAKVSMTQPVSLVGEPMLLATTNDSVGCIVDLLPRISSDTSTIELTVEAEVRSLHETVMSDGRLVQEVRPLKASAYKRLFDGQTLVVREAWGDADKRVLKRTTADPGTEEERAANARARVVVPGSRSLLVLITAQLVDAAGNALRVTQP